MARSGGCVLLRMIHRAGILLPDNAYFLFKGGAINGITWTGSAQGYSSYEINTVLKARAYLWNGVTGTGSSSIVTQHLDLRGFKRVHFLVSGIAVLAGQAPNIRVYPNYVSLQNSAPFEAVYDLSAISDLSNVMLMIQSGHLNKQSSSGSINAEVVVSAVWATRD